MLAVAIGVAEAARAEIILDDFDDPASVVAPAMLNSYVDTPNVGDLGATRSIRIFGLLAAPVGRIDVGIADSSAFVASLDELNASSSTNSKFAVLQFEYSVATPDDLHATVDVADGGRNNAILLDFKRLTTAATPRFLRVLVRDHVTNYESSIIPVPLSADSFTAAFPFDSFQLRGGGLGLPDFRFVRSLDFELRVVGGNGPPDLEIRMELDRIRFGRIPEPSIAILSCTGLLNALALRRCRSLSRCLDERKSPCGLRCRF